MKNLISDSKEIYNQTDRLLKKGVIRLQNNIRRQDLNSLYSKIKFSYNVFKQKKLLNLKYYVNKSYNIGDTKYIASECVDSIKKKKILTRYKYKNLIINFYDNRKISQTNKYYIKIVNRILVLNKLYSNTHNILEINSSLSTNKRCLTDNILGPNNVNGGVTLIGEYCFVYRKQEAYKVLVHELLHLFGYELPYNIQATYMNKISTLLCYDSKHKLINESYVESTTTILNVIFFMIENNIPLKNIINLIKIEIGWSIIVACKILLHNGFSNFDELLNRGNCKKIFKENSNVLSYYIIRSSLLYNIDYLLNIILEKISIRDLNSKLVKILFSQKYIGVMNNVCVYLKKNKYSKNLRMSVFESR